MAYPLNIDLRDHYSGLFDITFTLNKPMDLRDVMDIFQDIGTGIYKNNGELIQSFGTLEEPKKKRRRRRNRNRKKK
jgi:hypothetical protein